jgi:hypothetical protein
VLKAKITTRRLLAVAALFVLALAAVTWYMASREVRRATDDGFSMLEDKVSPDKKHRLLVYHYDTGAFGYSRAFWAVTPADYQNINLADYELPDRYMGEGWSEDGELLIKKWEPYYYPDEYIELETGAELYGVRIRLNTEEAKQSSTPK